MDSTIIVALIGGIFGLGGTVVGVIGNVKSRKAETAKVEIAAQMEADKQKYERNCRDDKAVRDGLQCLLRAEIIRSYDKYSERGTITYHGKEALDRAYKAYHDLGGNDVATDLYGACRELPVE